MINFTQRVSVADQIDDYLELPYELRQKSRLRVSLRSGREGALYLERGTILRGGDILQSECGLLVQVVAAKEAVYDVMAKNTKSLMVAAYHLGNRHVPLQIGDGWIRLEQDYVLKEMLLGLSLNVIEHLSAFEPEAGAYGGGHRHGHDDDSVASLRPPARMSQRG
jgi:urease accessory protein